ncbi:MAG: AAC(3) family N-acetyltransferase [Turicibacter sp.]|nr:AAC(3) family N-acetyltransferase [Turicibacter sp.]
MYTKQDLLNQLSALNIDPSGTLKIHVSYKAIGEVEGRGDTVLDALATYMKPGLLVLPSHTWGNVTEKNPVMDVIHTPSCVGALTELFRKRPEVHRSLHPAHSVVALGKAAAEFVAGEEKLETPCGKGGAYYKLWEKDAQILLIGVNSTRNTFIHGIEEWDGAQSDLSPHRKDFYVINHEGKRLHTPQYHHTGRVGSEAFSKIEPQAIEEGVMTLGKFGAATTLLMSAKKLRNMVASHLKKDPLYFSRF